MLDENHGKKFLFFHYRNDMKQRFKQRPSIGKKFKILLKTGT
jgi:hypothetical protein